MSDGPKPPPTLADPEPREGSLVKPILNTAQVTVVSRAMFLREDDSSEEDRTSGIITLSLPPYDMSQHRFRVNPVKSYAERMIETRGELRRLVKSKLCEITGEPNAQMRWSRNAYMRDVVSRYRVRIEGWPLNEVPFKNLSDVTNLGKMEFLLRGWTEGTIYFRRITDAEFHEMTADPSPWIGPLEGLGIDDGDDATQAASQ